jgi:predicted Zn finger-like uncharacterized protein
MIAYQSYNTKSPLNGEAARWVDDNLEQLPLDTVNMDVEEPGGSPSVPLSRATVPNSPPPATPASTPVAAVLLPENIEIKCPSCSSRLRVPAALLGRKARCPRCQEVITVPAGLATP